MLIFKKLAIKLPRAIEQFDHLIGVMSLMLMLLFWTMWARFWRFDMRVIAIPNILLRLTIWFLLTADFSVANIIIGVSIALLLPRSYTSPEKLKDWLQVLWEIVIAIPQAYIEAFQIMLTSSQLRRHCSTKS